MNLVENLTHDFFLETGARNGKLKVYEAVEHPAARALTGYLAARGWLRILRDRRGISSSGARVYGRIRGR
jgi:Mn-containing catalase